MMRDTRINKILPNIIEIHDIEKVDENSVNELYQDSGIFMKHWPVPDSYEKFLPDPGSLGCFWEERGDKLHCGVDIYAPPFSDVISIESGQVIDKGKYSSPENKPWFNLTYYIVIKSAEKIMFKYTGLGEIFVHIGDYISSGQIIATLIESLNRENINHRTPFHMRELAHLGRTCMLHLELYKAPVTECRPYEFGEFQGKYKPQSLINPNQYLFEFSKAQVKKNTKF